MTHDWPYEIAMKHQPGRGLVGLAFLRAGFTRLCAHLLVLLALLYLANDYAVGDSAALALYITWVVVLLAVAVLWPVVVAREPRK